MKNQTIIVVIVAFLSGFLFAGCTTHQMADEARSILEKYDLDGEIELSLSTSSEIVRHYDLIIYSDGFESLSLRDKKSALMRLDDIYITTNSKANDVMASVISQGYTYTLNYDDQLERDGIVENYPEPTKTLFTLPAGDFELSWNTWNHEYNTLGGILTIRRQGSEYTQTIVMSDGTSAKTKLTVISEDGGEIKLTDRPGNPFGDYMLISITGTLYFCDDQGVIYSTPQQD